MMKIDVQIMHIGIGKGEGWCLKSVLNEGPSFIS